jgi:hypothetical protein
MFHINLNYKKQWLEVRENLVYTAYKQTVSLFIAPYSFAGKVYAAVGNVPIVVAKH